nr:MAG TPA: DNA-binding domain protein [Caudoviricetes sp.]
MRDSVVFYRSFYDAIKNIPKDNQLEVYNAIMDYSMYGVDPDITGIALALFLAFKPQIDTNNERYVNGTKGGRPKKEKPMVFKDGENKKPMVSENLETEKPNEKENVKEKENIKENIKRKIFQAPTVEDVRKYCVERGNKVDPQSFIDFYESKGWMIGKNHMKDWKAAVRTWERSETKTRQGETAKLTKNHNNFERRQYDMDKLERQLMGG